MAAEDLSTALALLASFIALLLTSAKNRRDAEKQERDLIKTDLEILTMLDRESEAFLKISQSVANRTHLVYLSMQPYYRFRFYAGMAIYVVFALLGVYYSKNNPLWLIPAFAIAMFGFELQRRSLFREFSSQAEPISLASGRVPASE